MGDAPPVGEELLAPAERINLMRGCPNPSLFPKQQLKDAANAVLSDSTVSTDGLIYGPDSGYEPCLRAVGSWLQRFYRPRDHKGEHCTIGRERLCITGGASQNLGCMLAIYTDPEYTRNVWIVAPAYFLAFRIFEDAGFARKMKAVPEDEQGIDLAHLRKELDRSDELATASHSTAPTNRLRRHWSKTYKHVIYCVPTFANPSSRTMSLQHREELVRIARQYDALLIADDVYDFLRWPSSGKQPTTNSHQQAHLPRLVDIDRSLDGGAERDGADGFGNACSNGSFSKIVAPGVRVGWVEGTPKFAYGVSQCGTTTSGGAPSHLTSTYMTHLITSGALDDHIQDKLLPIYARRYRKLMSAVEAHLVPLGFSLPQPHRELVGGFFIWLSLPTDLTVGAEELAHRCEHERRVVIAPGPLFEVPGDEKSARFDRYMRLCFAWDEEDTLEEGVRRVAAVARTIADGNGHTQNERHSTASSSFELSSHK